MAAGTSASTVSGRANAGISPDDLARFVAAVARLNVGPDLEFGPILAAITPPDAASFVVRIQEAEAVVVAAHGLPASGFVGVRRHWAGGSGEEASSFGPSDRQIGEPIGAEHLAALGPGFKSGLGIRFRTRDGRDLGSLHLIDSRADRILEPVAADLARLAARQISLAIENRELREKLDSERAQIGRLERQLTEASKLGAVGELAAAVAHEVNNPLTGILGFAELLQSELPVADPRREDARVIMAEAVRARSIVRALLEFARPRPPQRIPSDLNELARGALDLISFRAQEAGVRIAEELSELPPLELDPDAIKQVLLNLFDNAIEAMPHGGELRVKTTRQGDRAGVIVADNGAGMDAETRKQIFTPFFSTRGVNRGGTGLGLSVGLQIVQGHSGTIEVESEPGSGTTFCVWLPITRTSFEGAIVVPGGDEVTFSGSDFGGGRDRRRRSSTSEAA